MRFSAHYGVPPECLRFSAAKVWENWIIAPAHLFGDTFGTPLRNCPIVWFHQLGCLHQKVVPLHMERLDSCQEERENKWKNANKDNCIPTTPTPLSLARSSHFILLFLGTYIYLVPASKCFHPLKIFAGISRIEGVCSIHKLLGDSDKKIWKLFSQHNKHYARNGVQIRYLLSSR